MGVRGRRRRITGILVVQEDDDRGTPRHRLDGQGALGQLLRLIDDDAVEGRGEFLDRLPVADEAEVGQGPGQGIEPAQDLGPS